MEIESLKNNGAAAYQPQSTATQSAIKTTSVRGGMENMELNTKIDGTVSGGRETQPYQQDGTETQQANQQQKLKNAVEDLNKQMHDSEAIFGIHDKTNRVTIKIVDKETKEVIKEYPPEQTLDMIAKVWEIAGIMVDEKR
ncbi:MAG: flagellar protein FlaG [Roseburia sp.]